MNKQGRNKASISWRPFIVALLALVFVGAASIGSSAGFAAHQVQTLSPGVAGLQRGAAHAMDLYIAPLSQQVNISDTATATSIATQTGTSTNTATATATATYETGEPTGAISGTVYLLGHTPAQGASDALVYAYTADWSHWTYAFTDSNGHYLLSDLPSDTYVLVAYPPSDYSHFVSAGISGIEVGAGTVTEQDVLLHEPVPMPPSVTLQPFHTYDPDQPPVVYMWDPLTLSVVECMSATATYEVLFEGTTVRGPLPMTENPPGTYTANVDPLQPAHGAAQIIITIHCPDGTTVTLSFDIYIDPSGVVQSFLPNGTPAALPLATVVLYRSDDSSGPFDIVPDGSVLMSPSNRRNPDFTVLNGHFGWDVVPGFYKVRASKVNCVKPGDTQAYVDTYVMEIPPPVTDLVLQLDCGKPTFTDVHDYDFFYNGATYLAAISVLSGYSNLARCPTGVPCFLPGDNVTRGQAAKIIGNATGLGADIPLSQQTFEDVERNTNPFWLQIERMAALGYVSGYPCGGLDEPCIEPGRKPYFRWNNPVTRSQLTKILVEANQYAKSPPNDPTFEDVPPGSPFYTYVETAYAEGLLGGYPCGLVGEPCGSGNEPYFRGHAYATRGQLSKMVTLTLVAP